MSFDLTGQKVSFTYQNLLQYIDGSYYNGIGEEVFIQDNSSLTNILASYISDASLSNDFFWNNGLLYVDVSVAGGGVSQFYVDASLAARDASLDYLFDWNSIQDISIVYGFDYDVIQDASIFALDASLNIIWNYQSIQDGSIQDLYNGDFVKNASLGDSFYYDSSSKLQTTGGVGNTLFGEMRFTAALTDTDPGGGKIGYNQILSDNVTEIRISYTGGSGVDIENVISSIKKGDSIYVQKTTDSANHDLWLVNGTLTDNTTFATIPVSGTTTDSIFSNNEKLLLVLAYTGIDISKQYVDGSLAARDVEIAQLDASIIRLDAYNLIQDASIAAGGGGISSYDKIQDVSIADLYVQVGDISVGYDPSTDYITNQPISGDISINYTGELVTSIVTNNWVGEKTATFVYDINEDVSVINLNNYGEAFRTITFEKDLEDNIIAVHIAG